MQQVEQHRSYVTLKAAEQEIGMTRVTMRKYLQQLGIDPITWHIGDRSLYITVAEKERIKQLKQNPSLLEHLRREQQHAASSTSPQAS